MLFDERCRTKFGVKVYRILSLAITLALISHHTILTDNTLVHPSTASRLLPFCLSLLILLFKVFYSSLELPIIFSEAMNVSEDHVFDFGEIVSVLNAVHFLLKLLVRQIGHIVNIRSVILGGEV